MSDASSREWIARALRTGNAPALDGLSAAELLDAAASEGMLPLLDWRLRCTAGFEAASEEFRDALEVRAKHYAIVSLHDANQIARVGAAFAAAGINALLLKGHALSRWLYPQPYLRVSVDIDLLFDTRESAVQAAQALEPLGYRLAFMPGSMNYEMTSRLTEDRQQHAELDLHYRLLNMPVFAERLGFAEMWAASLLLPGLGESMRVLSPLHALVHACLNRAVDLALGNPDELKRLYDIHLLLERMDAADRDAGLSLLRERGIGGVCLRSIEDAHQAFAGTVPANWIEALRAVAATEALDYRRMQDWRYMQWQNLKALPGTCARLLWLWQKLFPSTGQLRELHGEASWIGLMWRRAGRALLRVNGRT